MKKNVVTILLVIATLLTLFVGRLAITNRVKERTGYLQGDGTAHITERVMEIDLRGNVISVVSEKEYTIQSVSLERWITGDLYSY